VRGSRDRKNIQHSTCSVENIHKEINLWVNPYYGAYANGGYFLLFLGRPLQWWVSVSCCRWRCRWALADFEVRFLPVPPLPFPGHDPLTPGLGAFPVEFPRKMLAEGLSRSRPPPAGQRFTVKFASSTGSPNQCVNHFLNFFLSEIVLHYKSQRL
jgi:hypothetical protein